MIEVWKPQDVEDAIAAMKASGRTVKVTMLDPWYNKGFGGVRDDYEDYIFRLLQGISEFSEHVYLWGFPEIIAPFVKRGPPGHKLVAWLTWYYKNNPSVIRGWRSSQNACLHFSKPDAKLYPEHFMNAAQMALKEQGKLRYMPGPTSVIESALLTGFVGRTEQTGHPSQKPEAVYEPLLMMTCVEGDLVFDPMCGSGTTAAVARRLKLQAVLSDMNPEYVAMAERRAEGAPGRPPSDEPPAYDLGGEIPAPLVAPKKAKNGRVPTGRPRGRPRKNPIAAE